MRKIIVYTWMAALVLPGAGGLAAQELYVYPARNQSDEQMGRDKEECHGWAVKQTGVDPEKVATEATTPATSAQYPHPAQASRTDSATDSTRLIIVFADTATKRMPRSRSAR